jgi:hypothetical protein
VISAVIDAEQSAAQAWYREGSGLGSSEPQYERVEIAARLMGISELQVRDLAARGQLRWRLHGSSMVVEPAILAG